MSEDKLRIIAIFAHPDDAEVKMGGTAALWSEMGHSVKFVSLTNGDAGHHEKGGGELAKIRHKEAQEAKNRLGIDEYSILNNHDAELLPKLHIRHQVIREIRDWKADLVIGLRPNDYHPDHRYAGVLVMDAAYLVIVPNVVPDAEPLKKNPVFLYMQDPFQKPNPFSPDITIDVTKTFSKKIDAMDAHKSQFYEWLPWTQGLLEHVPDDADDKKRWLAKWLNGWLGGDNQIPSEFMNSLRKWYGNEEKINRLSFTKVEAFEIAEYGHQPTDDEIGRLFPMLNKES
ncbi:MAG: PIG-L family deacetylase [Balneolaceae bacterium]|nr:PIG-L family deacetylase [Balneolaceae bacterium]MDR9408270.1 PIG-L family deacetylase [Balneolaceae bacterium]